MKSVFKKYLVSIIILVLLQNIQSQQDNSQQNIPDPAMLYVYDFQDIMSKMFPTQTFIFQLKPGEQQRLFLWPPVDVQTVNLAFYTHNQQNPQLIDGKGFFSDCIIDGVRLRQFTHQKLGACTFNITRRPSSIALNFKTQQTPLRVYVSYENKKIKLESIPVEKVNQNVQTLQQNNKEKLKEISKKFERVKVNIQTQQYALNFISKFFNKHNNRFQNNIKYANHRIVLQTIMIVFGGLLGMWILKKQLNRGYELLV